MSYHRPYTLDELRDAGRSYLEMGELPPDILENILKRQDSDRQLYVEKKIEQCKQEQRRIEEMIQGQTLMMGDDVLEEWKRDYVLMEGMLLKYLEGDILC